MKKVIKLFSKLFYNSKPLTNHFSIYFSTLLPSKLKVLMLKENILNVLNLKIKSIRKIHKSFNSKTKSEEALCKVYTISCLFLLLLINKANGQPLNGTYNIPSDYATLAEAITALNTCGVGTEGVTINLLADNLQMARAGSGTTGGGFINSFVQRGIYSVVYANIEENNFFN